MRKKKNPDAAEAFEYDPSEIDDIQPGDLPPWYKQFLVLDESMRKKIANRALKAVSESKPDTFEFIRKHKMQLVGLMPVVNYALMAKDQTGELDVTYEHAFSQATLLYWCKAGGFGVFVNAVLEYNDTVLNKVKGNKVDRDIKGFTG